ncbi:F-box/kelch-repeat protein [Pyrus ussuriensis x Pyrus communis]|uniref:F-box/kelch-repeat protein n=1 Tax=Pyrus ussuriensis x Pyrus communis TaxID=2448454 RepID=A0A5N5FC28_9ROSA|nr:F-box/kelch-repeat protein [Pyrus ussuriensis x Pyrus communis]
MLFPSKFAFSTDPLHHTWTPRSSGAATQFSRCDPIFALVGHLIVVAGSTYDYEDDHLAVRHEGEHVGTCNLMPVILKDSAASTWFSVAIDDSKMYVTNENTDLTYTFDPDSKTCAVNLKTVKVWEVNGVSLECKRLIGEMPPAMVEKLKGETDYAGTVLMSCMRDMVCLHNTWSWEELILCELVDCGYRRGSVRNALVVMCSNVGLPDSHKAVQLRALKVV